MEPICQALVWGSFSFSSLKVKGRFWQFESLAISGVCRLRIGRNFLEEVVEKEVHSFPYQKCSSILLLVCICHNEQHTMLIILAASGLLPPFLLCIPRQLIHFRLWTSSIDSHHRAASWPKWLAVCGWLACLRDPNSYYITQNLRPLSLFLLSLLTCLPGSVGFTSIACSSSSIHVWWDV